MTRSHGTGQRAAAGSAAGAPPESTDTEVVVVPPKQDVFGVGVSVTTYEQVVGSVIAAAKQRMALGCTALATHGLMLGAHDRTFNEALRAIDIVTPDGQPVRWALNRFGRTALRRRVYGPDLMDFVCEAAARERLPVFLLGSTRGTLDSLQRALLARYPRLVVAGAQPDRFREATPEEDEADLATIESSGARIVFVGRGCPRQERWVADHRTTLPLPALAVGAAFDYLAGELRQPPSWMQEHGLEWGWRLSQEPRRLWRRYLLTNTQYIVRYGTTLVGEYADRHDNTETQTAEQPEAQPAQGGTTDPGGSS